MTARTASSIWNDTPTTEATDDSSPVVAGDTYPALQSVIVDTSATGTYVDINGKSAVNDAPVSVRIPNGSANAVISAGAEITVAEFALVEMVTAQENQLFLTGDAVERLVLQRNRNQTITFGDFQFYVPGSGNSSMRMRKGSGSQVVTNFITHWSHQQGGASEEAISFTQTTTWRYWRIQGLTLTQHNNFQEAWFESDGWTYHCGVIVGGSWQNNRFFFTRWRVNGVKGQDGVDGIDGAAGAPGLDGTDGTDGRGMVTAHRSDGVTAIGGTVYTLDHIIYEYTDGVFEDKGLLIAPPATIDYFQGNNVEYLIPGEFWDGKQVYGRSFERQLNTGNITLIANGIVDELLDFNGQLYHAWFGLNVAGDCTDSRYSWKIGFRTSTDKSVIYRSYGSSDAHDSATISKFAVKYTKQ